MIEKARPKSIQQPALYLTRSLFRFSDPTGLMAPQWRLIAREPVNRSAQRFIIRELSALEWLITSTRRNDPRVDEYVENWDAIFEDGQGWNVWLSRMVEDTCTLPFGGACEVGYRGDELEWTLHVDATTLLPTYERLAPYVQVNPDNATQRVYFKRNQLRRLRVSPRPDIRYKEYQISPTEDAFLEIEALSKIYLYYMQELTDTPPLGILDMMDFSESEVVQWARNFREMIEGVDPIKVPLLYDHEKPATFIPFGRSPQDLNIVEQFKRFAELLLSKYGLSIGDLRLFEHDSTKAGERVSQLVTERQGIGFWAAIIADFVTSLLPQGLTFSFKQPRPERELVEANRKSVQLAMLQAATGSKALISVKDAVEEAEALQLFTTPVKPLDEDEQPPAPVPPQLQQPEDVQETEEEQDADADRDLTKAYVEKQLGAWKHPEPPARERLEDIIRRAFAGIGEAVPPAGVGEIIDAVEAQLQPVDGVAKGGPGSGNWGHAGRPGKRGGSMPRSMGSSGTVNRDYFIAGPGKNLVSELDEKTRATVVDVMVNGGVQPRHIRNLSRITTDEHPDSPWQRLEGGRTLGCYAPQSRAIHLRPDNEDQQYVFAHELGHHVSSASKYIGDEWKVGGILKTGFDRAIEKYKGLDRESRESALAEIGLTSYSLFTSDEFKADAFRVYLFGSKDQKTSLSELIGVESIEEIFGRKRQ